MVQANEGDNFGSSLAMIIYPRYEKMSLLINRNKLRIYRNDTNMQDKSSKPAVKRPKWYLK